jgi:hypothetical protein
MRLSIHLNSLLFERYYPKIFLHQKTQKERGGCFLRLPERKDAFGDTYRENCHQSTVKIVDG